MKKMFLLLAVLFFLPLSAHALIFDVSGMVVAVDENGSAHGIDIGTPVNGYIDIKNNFLLRDFRIDVGNVTGYSLEVAPAPLGDGGILAEWVERGEPRTGIYRESFNSVLYYGISKDKTIAGFSFHLYKDDEPVSFPEFGVLLNMTNPQPSADDAPIPEPAAIFLIGASAVAWGFKKICHKYL
jgi:hypothetical protein